MHFFPLSELICSEYEKAKIEISYKVSIVEVLSYWSPVEVSEFLMLLLNTHLPYLAV